MSVSRKSQILCGLVVAISMSSNLVAAQGFDLSLLTDCWEWVIGFSTESCTATCAQVGRTCDNNKIGEINSMSALSDAISTSFLLGSADGPGTMATFCDGGVNLWPFATAPAAFAYQTFVPNPNNPAEGVFKISHYCYFPTSPAEFQGDCDTEYALVPSQRICSCYNGACPPTFAPTYPPVPDPTAAPTVVPTIYETASPSVVPTVAATQPQCDEWVLGYSTESCTQTCNRVSGTCNAANLASIVTQQAFYDMVAVANSIDASCPTGYDADVFCTKGVNTYSYEFAKVPAAFAYRTHRASGRATETFCNYPLVASNMTDNVNCDKSYVYPPSRRFCSCTGNCPPPTAVPTVGPTVMPSAAPTMDPTTAPSVMPTFNPTADPTVQPTVVPTATPSASPSVDPSVQPTVSPSTNPTVAPSAPPTEFPTFSPSTDPSVAPSVGPSVSPSVAPSAAPTEYPTYKPTADPSVMPSVAPSAGPTADPSVLPTLPPTVNPSAVPSTAPSASPSVQPSVNPSAIPTIAPSASPSAQPSVHPTADPTVNPTIIPPTMMPTLAPSADPTLAPSLQPSVSPSQIPTASPTGCFKFIIGYSEKSCTETCSDPEVGTGGVCENSIINTIDTLADFSSMLTSAILLGSGGSSPASVAAFCSGGVNTFPFANSPAAFAYQQYVALPAPHYVVSNYCYYRPAVQGPSTDTCDTKYLYPPSQRMCACRVASCVDNGAFPMPNYRRLEAVEEEENESVSAVEALDSALTVTTTATAAVAVVEEKKAEVAAIISEPAVAVEEVSIPASASDSVVQSLLSEVPVMYQYAGAAALVLALLCAVALYNALTTTKTAPAAAPAYCSSPSKGVTWAATLEQAESSDASKNVMHATRNPRKREVYIDMPDM